MIGQTPLVKVVFFFFQNGWWVVGWDERERSMCHNEKQFLSTERLILSSVFINVIHYEIVTIDQKSRPTVDDRVDTLCVCEVRARERFYIRVSMCVCLCTCMCLYVCINARLGQDDDKRSIHLISRSEHMWRDDKNVLEIKPWSWRSLFSAFPLSAVCISELLLRGWEERRRVGLPQQQLQAEGCRRAKRPSGQRVERWSEATDRGGSFIESKTSSSRPIDECAEGRLPRRRPATIKISIPLSQKKADNSA